MNDPSFDPARCPICERENACGMAAGAATCWCFSVQMPREVIDRVPVAARGAACICRACAAERGD